MIYFSNIWLTPSPAVAAGALLRDFARRLLASPRRKSGWRSLWRPAGRRATAALELALAAPLLAIVLGGASDYGLAQYYRVNLANAVEAGCQYAYLTFQAGGTVTTTNVKSVVQDAMFLPSGATANLSISVTGPTGYCVTGAGPAMTAVSLPTTCGDGSAAGTYMLITATYTSSGLMNGFLSAASNAITETATARLN
jgi:hypothetical protein